MFGTDVDYLLIGASGVLGEKNGIIGMHTSEVKKELPIQREVISAFDQRFTRLEHIIIDAYYSITAVLCV